MSSPSVATRCRRTVGDAMRVIPSQDERDLAAMCRSVLAAELEPDAQWKALADAGVLGLVVDGSLTDVGVFCLEAGRALCPRVVQSTVYAALAVDWLGVGSGWLPRLTSGETRGDLCVVQPAGCVRRDAAAAGTTRRRPLAGERCRGLRRRRGCSGRDRRERPTRASSPSTPRHLGITVEPVPMMGGFAASTVRFDDVVVDERTPSTTSSSAES